MLPLSCTVKYNKWYFSADILCAPQFHRLVIYKTTRFYYLFIRMKNIVIYLFLIRKAFHYSEHPCCPSLHFFKFYYVIFEMVEAELSAIFKINEHPTLILWPNIFFFSFFISFIIIPNICSIFFAAAVHQPDIQNYLLQPQELTPGGESQLRAYDFICEFKAVSSHLHLSSQNFICHFITHSTQHCKLLLQVITGSSSAH